MQSGSSSGPSEAPGVELDEEEDGIAQSLVAAHFPEDTEGGEAGNRCSQSVAITPT